MKTAKRKWQPVTRMVELQRERCSCGSVEFYPWGTQPEQFGMIRRRRKCKRCGVVTLFVLQ